MRFRTFAIIVALALAVVSGIQHVAEASKAAMQAWKSELVEYNLPAGQYGLLIPSQDVGQGVIDTMNDYSTKHTDRYVKLSSLVVVTDKDGKAKFYVKISYKDR